MYGRVLGASTSTGAVGAVLLPNTGSSRPLLYAAVMLLSAGIVALLASGIIALKRRGSEIN